MTVALLGDSLSVGAFPFLRARVADAESFAVGGMQTPWMYDQLPKILARHPRMVLVEGGVNDLASGATPEIVIARLGKIATALEDAGVPYLIGTNPPERKGVWFTPEVYRLNAMILDHENSLDTGGAVPVTDVGPDGLHLSPAGYRKLANAWADAIEEPKSASSRFGWGAGFLLAAAGLLWWQDRRGQDERARAR